MVVENHYPFVFLSCTPEILVIPYLQERGEPTSTSPRDARSLRLSILGHRLLAQLRCRVSLAVLMEENNTRSPEPVAHKSALTQQSWRRRMVAQRRLEAETPRRHADHTHFSSVRPHSKPGYARDKFAPDAFLRWRAVGPRII